MKRYDDLHLTAMLKAPLLRPEQEIQLGRQVQRWQELLAHRGDGEPGAWAERCGVTPTELAGACKRGQRARDRMIVCNTRLVVSISRRYLSRCGDLEPMDLFQYGVMGLHTAVCKYDPARGYKLSTYATKWIQQSMTRAIHRYSRAVRIPEHIYQSKAKIIRHIEEAWSQGERQTLDQAFEALGLSGRIDYIRAAEVVWSVLSSDSVAPGMDSDTTTIESIAAPVSDDDPPVELGPEHKRMMEAIGNLSPRTATIVRLRYGLDGKTALSINDIATAIGISDRSVRSSLNNALPRLRTLLSVAP